MAKNDAIKVFEGSHTVRTRPRPPLSPEEQKEFLDIWHSVPVEAQAEIRARLYVMAERAVNRRVKDALAKRRKRAAQRANCEKS